MTARRLKAKTAAELTGALMKMQPLQSDSDKADLVAVREPTMTLAEMTLSAETRAALDTIVLEHQHAAELGKHGLAPAWSALLVGEPGTGKTSAAGALATALDVPLVVIGNVTGSLLSASERNVRKVFERAGEMPAVYLLDEIDAIGAIRGGDDAGGKGFGSASKEYNLLLTSMLSCMDMHAGPGLVIATSNRLDVIDPALRRRFDLELVFPLPDHDQAIALAKRILADDGNPELVIGPLAGKSYSDIVRLARAERKRQVLAAIVTRAAKRAARAASKQPTPADATDGTGTETDPPPTPADAIDGTSARPSMSPIAPASMPRGTDTPPSSLAPAPTPPGTTTTTPTSSEPAPAPRGTGGPDVRSAPGPAMPGTGTASSDRGDQGRLPL